MTDPATTAVIQSRMAIPTEHLIDDPKTLSECCAHLAGCPVVGFDTEFVGENSYHPELCLIQLATPERLYLLDPLVEADASWLTPFWATLLEPARTVVVHAGREEAHICERATGRRPDNFFDVQLAAGLVGFSYPIGHAGLVQQLLHRPVAKGETLTDWRRRPLTRQQVRYAYDDVRHLLELHRRLHAQLAELDRLEWAAEEFAGLLERVQLENPNVERWRKLRGLSHLNARQLAVARALFEWREEYAAKGDRPPRTVLRDDVVVEVARRRPKAATELTVLRGMNGRVVAEVFAVINRAWELPDEDCPQPVEHDHDPPEVSWLGGVLNAALGALCADWQLAVSLTATTADVKQLVRAELAGTELPAETGLARGWRAQQVLPVLRDLLHGRRGFRIDLERRPVPFRFE